MASFGIIGHQTPAAATSWKPPILNFSKPFNHIGNSSRQLDQHAYGSTPPKCSIKFSKNELGTLYIVKEESSFP
jgi:hypothetical protein